MRQPSPPIASGELPLNTTGAFVYRAFDTDGALLYVGYTEDLHQRVVGHWQSRSPWVLLAKRLTWEFYATPSHALRAEQCAIETERPRFNKRYNDDRIIADRMGHSRRYDEQDWQRLGVRIKQARTGAYRGVTRFVRDAGIKPADLRELEAGTGLIYDRTILTGVESALGWQPGSLEAILSGGEPTPLTADQRTDRAIASARRVTLGDRL